MKNLIKKSAIAVAVSVALGSSVSWAENAALTTTAATNTTDVSLAKDVSVTKDLTLAGTVDISGKIVVNSNALAVVDNKQLNHDNTVNAPDPDFTASTGAISGNQGNVGINVGAGENLQQDNAAAIAATDKTFVLGSTDAESFTQQQIYANQTHLVGATFKATADAVSDNAGNIGVNVSSGISNLQKNNLAISSGVSGLAEASSATLQETTSIDTTLESGVNQNGGIPVTYTSSLVGVSGNAGNIGVNVSTGNNNAQANSLSIASVLQ